MLQTFSTDLRKTKEIVCYGRTFEMLMYIIWMKYSRLWETSIRTGRSLSSTPLTYGTQQWKPWVTDTQCLLWSESGTCTRGGERKRTSSTLATRQRKATTHRCISHSVRIVDPLIGLWPVGLIAVWTDGKMGEKIFNILTEYPFIH